jgi:hypothetical protein
VSTIWDAPSAPNRRDPEEQAAEMKALALREQAQREWVNREMRRRKDMGLPPPIPVSPWLGEPALTPRALLDDTNRCPLTGRPLDLQLTPHTLPWQQAEIEKANRDRFAAWAQLSAPAKTQLVACLRWRAEDAPFWRVGIPDEPSQPVILLKASNQPLATQRYQELCGILSTVAPIKADLSTPAPGEEEA